MSSDEYTSTGITDLDLIIGGGFPKGSLILVAGNPGTGKTIFSAQWVFRGATDQGENGIYVSFAESRESFYRHMRSFGFDFERLEKEGKFRFLDMVTVKEEGITGIMETILNEVLTLKAKRLVIDSFSAMAQAFERPIDTRSVLHTILSKMIRQVGCTTLLVVEIPNGESKIGYGIEEFIADVVLHLRRIELDNVTLRDLTILKIRGSEIMYPKVVFTIKNGFQVFPPLTVKEVEQPIGRYRVIPHPKDHFSTGIRDLDQLLSKMFRRGGYDLLEVEKDVTFPLERLIRPTVCNFLNQGYGVVILPPQGLSASTIMKTLENFVEDFALRNNLRIVDYKGEIKEPHVILLDGTSIEEDMRSVWNAIADLRKKTRKPVFSVMGFDTVDYTYGGKEALKIIGEDIARTRNLEDLRLNIIRPAVDIADQLKALADIHLRVEQIHGALFLRGVKPRTPLLNVKVLTNKEFSEVKLTPVV